MGHFRENASHDGLVEHVAADLIGAVVHQLHHRVSDDAAQRQVERSTSPVEHERQLSVEMIEACRHVPALEESVECCERFMDELRDSHPRLREGLPQRPPLVSFHVHRDRHDGACHLLERLGLADSMWRGRTRVEPRRLTMSTGSLWAPSMVMLSSPRCFFGDRRNFP